MPVIYHTLIVLVSQLIWQLINLTNHNRPVSQMREPLGGLSWTSKSYKRLLEVLYVFEHKTQYLFLIHASNTLIVVFWQISHYGSRPLRKPHFQLSGTAGMPASLPAWRMGAVAVSSYPWRSRGGLLFLPNMAAAQVGKMGEGIWACHISVGLVFNADCDNLGQQSSVHISEEIKFFKTVFGFFNHDFACSDQLCTNETVIILNDNIFRG